MSMKTKPKASHPWRVQRLFGAAKEQAERDRLAKVIPTHAKMVR
jgi:hypothetical protein